MDRIPQRDLRNNIGAVLRRVEAGEHLEVTVDGRPVAALVPLPSRRRLIPASAIWDRIVASRADAGLADALAEMFPETTDDIGP